MRTFAISLVSALIFILCSCDPKINSKDQVFKKTDNSESLEFWTSDTILNTNYKLVQLMDTLYQFVRSDSFPSRSLKREIMWMENYRLQLCAYFDAKHSQCSNASLFEKADSVISEARALWRIDTDYSTMGMIIKNNVERTRLIFEQFNEYGRLQSVCETETQKNMLYTEFVEWIKLEQLFSMIFANCVDLHFWGGSIAEPVRTSGYLSIWQSHVDLYQKEYIILASYNGGWTDTGTFLTPARDLFMSCCEHALTEYYYPEETDERYKELYRETQKLMQNLPQYIDSWINARKPWEEEMSTDFLHQTYSRNTSGVLIKLANIISSVQ